MAVNGLPDQISAIVNGEKPVYTDVADLVDGKLYWIVVKKTGQTIERSIGLTYKATLNDYIAKDYELVSALDTFYAPDDVVSIKTPAGYREEIAELKEELEEGGNP